MVFKDSELTELGNRAYNINEEYNKLRKDITEGQEYDKVLKVIALRKELLGMTQELRDIRLARLEHINGPVFELDRSIAMFMVITNRMAKFILGEE